MFNQPETPKGEDPNFVEVDISISCPVCDKEPNTALYNKAKKKIKTVCEDHESIFDMDLSWLVI